MVSSSTWPHGAPFSFRSYIPSCPFSASPASIPIPINERPPSSQEFYYTVSVLVCKVGECNERPNRSCIGDLPSHLGTGGCAIMGVDGNVYVKEYIHISVLYQKGLTVVEWKRIWMTGRFVGVDHFACLWPKALSPSLYLSGYGVSVVLWHSGYHAIIYAANCCCHEHLAAYPEDR